MLERGIRHAPVVNERGQLVGVIEDLDLFAVQPRSWFGARRAIARAQSVESLATVAGRLPEIVSDLHAANLRALEVARVLSALVDALTVRAIELAGAVACSFPTTDWCGSRVGSQARRELTPASTRAAARSCAASRRRRAGARRCPRRWRAAAWTGTVVARSGREWLRGRRRRRAVADRADRAPGPVGHAAGSVAGRRGRGARPRGGGTRCAARSTTARRPGSTPIACSSSTARAATCSTSGGPR